MEKINFKSHFQSRYILKTDYSFPIIPVGNNKYFRFAELQKQKKRSWHSRPYEYAFVFNDLIKAYVMDFIKFDSIVLDLACGANHPGYMMLADLFLVDKVVATDSDKNLLTNDFNHPRVQKIIADATDIGFKEKSFDAIVCISAIEHISDWRKVVREISYLLKPSGMAFVTFDISTDISKTMQHNIDDKLPCDYAAVFENFGLSIFGWYDDNLYNDSIDAINSKYPLAKNKSELLNGQHNALKTFKMVLRK